MKTMQRIIDRLRRRRWCQYPSPAVKPMRPVYFGRNGRVSVNRSTLKQLEHLYSLGFLYREQMEAASTECCLLLGVDPEADTNEADAAREIVLAGVDVWDAIGRISQLRSDAAKSQ